MAKHVEAMVGFLDAGAEVFDYGNSIRGEAQLGGYERAFAFPGFVPAYIRPLFCEGKGPFRWAALSGDPADIAATDRAVLDLFPENESLAPLDPSWPASGSRSRACRRGSAGSATASGTRPGCGSTRWSPPASSRAPIVIGRDHLDCGSVASPVPRDRGDARRLRRDRRLAAAQRAGQHGVAARPGCRSTTAAASASAARSTPARSRVADGTALAAQKIERVLTNDPGMGVIRHVDAGYERAERGRRRARRAHPDAGGVTVPTASARRWRPVRRAVARRWRRSAAIAAHRRLPAVRLDRGRRWPAASGSPRRRRTAASTVETDRQRQPVGLVGRPGAPADAVVTGSHLDSVPRRRRLRRPARRRLARSRRRRCCASAGFTPGPAARRSSTFAEEEGARFGVACLGSRLLTGALDADRARGADATRDGVTLAEAMAAAGLRPGGRRAATRTGSAASARSSSCTSSRAGRWPTLDAPVGVASAIWPHGRWRLDFTGEANHAGTTRLADRHDPMLTFADTVLAASEAGPAAPARAPPSAGSRSSPTAPTRSPSPGQRLARRPRRGRVHTGRAGRRRSRPGRRARPAATAPR